MTSFLPKRERPEKEQRSVTHIQEKRQAAEVAFEKAQKSEIADKGVKNIL